MIGDLMLSKQRSVRYFDSMTQNLISINRAKYYQSLVVFGSGNACGIIWQT